MRYKKYFLFALVLISVVVIKKIISNRALKVSPVIVATIKAKQMDYATSVSALGTVKAQNAVNISAQTSGFVQQINFVSGQEVKAGDLLATLQNDETKALWQESLAKLNLAKQNLARYQMLIKKGNASQADFDKYNSQYMIGVAEADYAAARYAQTFIRAPFAGKLGLRKVNLGQYISPGDVIANLQASAPLYIDFALSEQYANLIKIGANIIARREEDTQYKIRGKVIALDSVIDKDTRTIAVRALLDENMSPIYPGLALDVKLTLNQKQIVTIIPQAAIVYSLQGEYVYVVNNHAISQVPVQLGDLIDNNIIVLTGIKPNTQVVCAGQIKLHPGVRVNTVAYDIGI
jgi:RND family efflux transporter MFP subunit